MLAGDAMIDTIRLFMGDIEATVRTVTVTTNGSGLFGMGTVREITVQAVITDDMIKAARNKISDEEVIKGLTAIKDDLE